MLLIESIGYRRWIVQLVFLGNGIARQFKIFSVYAVAILLQEM